VVGSCSRQTAASASATRIPSETSMNRCTAINHAGSARGMSTTIANVDTRILIARLVQSRCERHQNKQKDRHPECDKALAEVSCFNRSDICTQRAHDDAFER
jgi:hypothetical protein